MKKILFIISFALLSTSVQSQKSDAPNKLWTLLDINTDGSISKAEASVSKGVFVNWERLDTNKDEKLDIAEFSKLFYRESQL